MAILIAGQTVPRESVSVTTDPDLETDRLAARFKPAQPFLLFAPASGAIALPPARAENRGTSRRDYPDQLHGQSEQV